MPEIGDKKHVLRQDARGGNPNILSVDIGGTLIKAAVIDQSGALVSEFVTTPTPHPATPDTIIALIIRIAAPLPDFGLISVGFPGVVHRECISTAPNLGTAHWKNAEFAVRAHIARDDKPRALGPKPGGNRVSGLHQAQISTASGTKIPSTTCRLREMLWPSSRLRPIRQHRRCYSRPDPLQ